MSNNFAMKYLIPFLLLIMAGCGHKSPESLDNTASVHTYSEPAFENPLALDDMAPAFPVIDQLFRDFAERNNLPSVSYGIIAGGQLIHSGSVGVANLATNTASSEKTLYRVASMSKSFTALGILKLRDEGLLSLTDCVAKYIPEMKGAGQLTSDAPPVTILNLLTMSAGFPEDNPWGDRQLDDTDDELLGLVREGISFSNVPGITYEYSNVGYALLGRIIATVSGKPFQQYITEVILEPLGMTSTKWEFDDIPPEQLAPGYMWTNGSWSDVPLLHDGAYGAMGGLISSVDDFSKYVAFHLNAWPPRNSDDSGPLRRSSVREMHQPWRFSTLGNSTNTTGKPCPYVTAYGYGVRWRKDCTGIVSVGHSGGLPGFGSEWHIYPDYGIGIVSFANRTYSGTTAVNNIALDTLIAIAGLRPRTLAPSEILKKRFEEVIAILPEWDEDKTSIFADNFFQDEPLEKRRENTRNVFEEAGPIIRVYDPEPVNQLRGTLILEGEKKNIRIFLTLNPEREALIQRLDISAIAKTNQ